MNALKQKPADLLREAKKLIANPEHWTQGTFARDAEGNSIDSHSPRAVSWCAYGACSKVGADNSYLFFALPPSALQDLTAYNDDHVHRTVIRLFNKAIELAERPR